MIRSWSARWLILLALLPFPWAGDARARSGRPDDDVPDRTGRPVCVHVGTRSEGWAWPSGRFIRWARCKGVVPVCRAAGPKRAVEGWYANGVLIAPDMCAKGGGKHR